MGLHIRCEVCNVKFTDLTGRELIQAFGGEWLDVCKNCASMIEAEKEGLPLKK